MPDDPSRPGGAPPGGTKPDGGIGGGLNKKMAGLPTWAWIALAAAGGIVALVWMQNRRKADDTGSSTASQGASGDDAVVSTEQYESLLALLRDLQGGDSTPVPGTTTPPADGVTKPGVYNPPPINPALARGVGWVHVKKGETAASVAKKYNTTVGLLQAYNTAATLNSFDNNGKGKWIRIRGRAGAMPT